MTQKRAVLRTALLLVVWFAASAHGAVVLAQPGSAGGTVGKTDKSLSGGQEAAPPAQSSTEKSNSNARETKSESQRKHVTRNSERSRPTRSPAAPDQPPHAPSGFRGGGPPSANCAVVQSPRPEIGGVSCD